MDNLLALFPLLIFMGFMMLILSVITVLGVAVMPAVPGLLRALTVVADRLDDELHR